MASYTAWMCRIKTISVEVLDISLHVSSLYFASRACPALIMKRQPVPVWRG